MTAGNLSERLRHAAHWDKEQWGWLREAADALDALQRERDEQEGYPGIAYDFNECQRELAASRQREARLREALTEVHEHECGCDRPGNLAACIAQPTEIFAALAGEEGAA